jgi:hypothetical protein
MNRFYVSAATERTAAMATDGSRDSCPTAARADDAFGDMDRSAVTVVDNRAQRKTLVGGFLGAWPRGRDRRAIARQERPPVVRGATVTRVADLLAEVTERRGRGAALSRRARLGTAPTCPRAAASVRRRRQAA